MNRLVFAVFIGGFILLIYTFVEARLLRVNRQTVISEKLPVSFHGYKIAFISDLHNYSKAGRRIRRVVNRINSLNPDIVLIGGDFNSTSTAKGEACYRELSKLNANCYVVLGNHDYYPDEELAKYFIRKYNLGSINNKSFWVRRNDERIKIGGMDDYWMGYPYPESFLHDLSKNDFSILVCHNPDYFEIFDMSYVSLALAGHHHGGQCSFFGLWAPMVRSDFGSKYSGKTFEKDGAIIVCSKGIGTSHIPVRFCAVPEINFITLCVGDKNEKD